MHTDLKESHRGRWIQASCSISSDSNSAQSGTDSFYKVRQFCLTVTQSTNEYKHSVATLYVYRAVLLTYGIIYIYKIVKNFKAEIRTMVKGCETETSPVP